MIETTYKVSNKIFKEESSVLKTTNKKEADEHDKMLDRAEKIYVNIESAVKTKEIKCNLEEKQIEEVSIHISKNHGDFAQLLKQPKKKATTKPEES